MNGPRHMADILGNPQSFHNFIQPFPRAKIFLEEKSFPHPPDVPPKASEKHRGIRNQIFFPTTTTLKKTKIPPPLMDAA